MEKTKLSLFLLSCAFISLLLIGISYGALTDNLIGSWNINDSSGNIVVKNVGSNGWTNGTWITGYNGTAGTGLTVRGFDTGIDLNVLRLNATTSINLTNNVTASFWAQIPQFAGANYFVLRFGDRTTNGNIPIGLISTSTTQLAPYQCDTGGTCSTGSAFTPKSGWNFYVMMRNNSGTQLLVWENGVLVSSATVTARSVGSNNATTFSAPSHGGGTSLGTNKLLNLSNVNIWDRSLSVSEILALNTTTINGYYPFGVSNLWYLTANDSINNQSILSFAVNLTLSNGTVLNYSTTNGTIITSIFQNFTGTVNVSGYSSGFFGNTSVNVNTSSGFYQLFFYRTFISDLVFSGNRTYNSSNWFRSLNYSFNIYLCSDNLTLTLFENSSYSQNYSVQCSTSPQTYFFSNNYSPSTEGAKNIMFGVWNNTYARFNTSNFSFVADLYNPNISLSYNLTTGFLASQGINTSMRCVDSLFTPLFYNLTFDSSVLLNSNFTANTTQLNQSNLSGGSHSLVGVCSDLFGSSSTSLNFSVYQGNFILWDEILNRGFNVSQTGALRLWQEDNASYYDFKANNRNNITIAVNSSQSTKFRVEQNFSTGGSVSRYIDLAVTNDSLIKVCTNPDGTTHYEQLLYSASIRYASIKNSYNGCYILSDYTRFAYQDAYSIRAYTINSNYYLNTLQNGISVLLASIEGVAQVAINLDNLEFVRNGFDIDIKDDALVFTKGTVVNTTTISYQNIEEDNRAVSLAIYREDNGLLLVNISNISTPNIWSVDFYWSLYPNTNASTLFRAVATITKSDGSIQTVEAVFDGNAQSGLINKALGITLTVLLVIGGLSLFSLGAILGWVGIFISVGALIVNILTEPNIVSTFLNALIGIIIVYQLIIIISMLNYGERIR